MQADRGAPRQDPVGFGPYTFSPEERELRRDGLPVRLQRQPALVLAYLIERRGRPVSRGELIRHVWNDGRHVGFDQSLNYCIRQIRRALNDGALAPQYLETVARDGYRWIADADPAPGIQRVVAGQPAAARRRRDWAIGAGSAIATTLALTLVISFSAPNRIPAVEAPEPSSPPRLTLALNALHVLSHALFEPGRRPEAERAMKTLWTVTASYLGWAFEGDLPR